MDTEKLIADLTQLNIDSNARLGRVNEIVSKLVDATISLQRTTEAQQQRTDQLLAIFDKHVTELECNRNIVQKEAQQLRDHCAMLTSMMERCQKMQSKCLDTIANLTHNPSGTSISIGDNNNI